MPWINLTVRKGAISKNVQHALMAKLTEVLMWWEKVPETPRARSIMKGWVFEVAEDADYGGGSPVHEKPFYFVEIRIPINRLDLLPSRTARATPWVSVFIVYIEYLFHIDNILFAR
jgi:hypothetical protein